MRAETILIQAHILPLLLQGRVRFTNPLSTAGSDEAPQTRTIIQGVLLEKHLPGFVLTPAPSPHLFFL